MKEHRLITVRKLAALDIVFHGSRLILIEFGLSVLLLALFGLFLTSLGSLLFGWYVLSLALNYVPLFVYAIAILSQEKRAR